MSPVLWAHLARRLPAMNWLAGYDRAHFFSDALAAVIVTIMLIPQSLAYAMLAGLPAEVGLYASILPLLAYAIFGSSRSLSVGPVAVVSLMTATAVGQVAEVGTTGYLTAALMLALLSGAMLTVMGLLRLGFLANYLSHPVISGFITAAGLMIAVGQMGHLFGISIRGGDVLSTLSALVREIGETNLWTFAIGIVALAFLFWARRGLKAHLLRLGIGEGEAQILAKAAPILTVVLASLLAWRLDLGAKGVALVGDVPRGLPALSLPQLDLALMQALWLPALMISVVGYVESISVAQTLAAKRREKIDPDQELIGLGAANIAAGLSGGFPVTGGLARSVVNFDAGARTPMAGVLTAVGIALTALLLTPALSFLPQTVLAATIILAVLGLVDLGALRRYWHYSKVDFSTHLMTILITLIWGVEAGLLGGVLLSMLLLLHRSSRPHMAVVGQVPGTEHYRNIARHEVLTCAEILSIRVDGSLHFANARFLEDQIAAEVSSRSKVTDVILLASAVNDIDASALDTLEAINAKLALGGIRLHLSEVKGPVMDRLQRSAFLTHLSGGLFLTHHKAVCALRGTCEPQIGAIGPRLAA